MKTYTPENMRFADKYTITNLGIPGTVLMDRAADALFDAVKNHLHRNGKFVILCGKGNNGGDGWALGMKLAKMYEQAICIAVSGHPATNDALYFYEKCCECKSMGFPVTIIDAEASADVAFTHIQNADVIVDTIFGTGFSENIESGSLIWKILELSNSVACTKLAADIPSGVDALTGKCADIAFRADFTVTFAKAKTGMMSYPARSFCGSISIADIGIPEDVFLSMNTQYEVTDPDTVRSYLPKRNPDSNKGSFGKLLIYAGCTDMTGAAHLAVLGALRSGVGLTAFASEAAVTDVIKHRLSEPIFITVSDSDKDTDRLVDYSAKCGAILIGCGLGSGEKVKKRVSRLIKECECPIILDADGINAISDNINIISEAKKGILLTPHPLEFSRITGKTVDEICASRLESAGAFSDAYGCCILLKGAGTVIRDRDGRTCINPIACSALSKGGSGDVLAGIIASFVAQGTGLYESAVIGAYIHGCAGEELSGELSAYGVMPSEIPERAARILSRII